MTGTRCLSPSLLLSPSSRSDTAFEEKHSVSRPARWTRNRAASHGMQGETSFRALAGNTQQTHEPTQLRGNTRSRAEHERTYSSRGSPGLSPSSVCFTFSFFSCLSGTSFTPPSLSRDEKEPLEESTLLTGSRLPKIFPRRIIRGTSSLARLSPPWSPLSWNLSVLQSELVVDAWNSSANDANRLNHPA